MSNIHRLPPLEQRYDEASLWIERLDEGLTASESEALQRWMAADPENRALLFRMARLWDKMDSLSRLASLFPDAGRKRRPVWTRHPVTVAFVTVLATVAVLWSLALFTGFVPPHDRRGGDVANAIESVYETALGEHATVTLADRTELVLNTNSRVRVKYTPQHRLLVLDAGEVHVRVAEDALRPLSVIAGGKIVQAVGTAFNVEITSDQRVELVVTEGRVRVGVHPPERDRDEAFVPAVLPESSVMVAAGEELILGGVEEEITPVSQVEIDVRLSWREGNLIFGGESLEEALAEVGRYTAVEFVILDEGLRKTRIAGLFKAGDVDSLLAVLRENFDIAYERVDEHTVLLSAL